MKMNDKDWNKFWDHDPDGAGEEDEEEEEEGEDYNGFGNDIDANNDETFDNAAEWNEDEHEELIARDSILSHTIRGSRSTSNSNNNSNANTMMNNNNNINNINNNSGNNNIMYAHRIEAQLKNETPRRSGWSPFGGKDLFTTPDSPTTQAGLFGPFNNQSLTAGSLQHQQQLMLQQQLSQLTLQQQQQILMQHHMLQQQQHHQQQQLHQQQMLQQRTALLEQEQRLMSMNPQCFTVEELERQMFAERRNDSTSNNNSLACDRNEKIKEKLDNRDQKDRANSNNNHNNRKEHVTREQHQQQHHQHQNQQRENQREHHQVKENNQREQQHKEHHHRSNEHRDHHNQHRERDHHQHHHHHRDRDNTNREHREQREFRNSNRDYHHHQRQNQGRAVTVIPPQVQLKVINEARRLHSITAMHSDEFLLDRKPTSSKGFQFKRHSTVLSEKKNHDGILTERERSWLTRIQEKIQADYDDNIDQDYYYLLYFNRSSMKNEAAQKPTGPGVLDRRFIPRERLLYNSNA